MGKNVKIFQYVMDNMLTSEERNMVKIKTMNEESEQINRLIVNGVEIAVTSCQSRADMYAAITATIYENNKSVAETKTIEEAHASHQQGMFVDSIAEERKSNEEKQERIYCKALIKNIESLVSDFENQPLGKAVSVYLNKFGLLASYLESGFGGDFVSEVNDKLITDFEIAFITKIWGNVNNKNVVFDNDLKSFNNRKIYQTEKFQKTKKLILEYLQAV